MIKHIHLAGLFYLSIIIPGFIGADTIHVLSPGDTLYSLARQYGVKLDDILRENSITDPSSLAIGMKLIIPSPEKNSEHTHRVVKGDTYFSIARRYSLNVDELLQYNRRTAVTLLSIGEHLKIPQTATVSTSPPAAVPAYRPGGEIKVQSIPWWPVAGIKRPLEGKLKGVSIMADNMSYVHAVASGRVVWTGPYRGFGNVVLVDSDGYIYLYGGNNDLFVNVGQSVESGSRIGRLGTSVPNNEPQPMYFSVFREGVPVAPEDAPRG